MNYIKLEKKHNCLKLNYCFQEINYMMLKKTEVFKDEWEKRKKARINQTIAKLEKRSEKINQINAKSKKLLEKSNDSTKISKLKKLRDEAKKYRDEAKQYMNEVKKIQR